jgi:hypothetical protein
MGSNKSKIHENRGLKRESSIRQFFTKNKDTLHHNKTTSYDNVKDSNEQRLKSLDNVNHYDNLFTPYPRKIKNIPNYIPKWIDIDEIKFWNSNHVDVLPSNTSSFLNLKFLIDSIMVVEGFENKLSMILFLFDYLLDEIHIIKDNPTFKSITERKLSEFIEDYPRILSFQNVYGLLFKDY